VVHTSPGSKDPEPKAERRREQRIKLEEAVLISLLGPPGGPPIPAAILDISGSGVSLLSPRPLPGGTMVKVQGLNRHILGEVIRSDPEGDAFNIGLKVKHVLDRPSEL
jgi:hypothetical protein